MTEADPAREQVRILAEILSLTPEPAAQSPDLSAVRRALQLRQQLLDRFPASPTVSSRPGPLALERERLLAEIQMRDQALLTQLEQARRRTQRSLEQTWAKGAGSLFCGTA